MPIIERVLVSVSDKTGVVEFVRALAAMGIEVLSTGGTAATLRSGGVEVRDVSDYTGFPEIMGGRVKTLHPKIHGALLGRPDVDQAVMAEHGIAPIGMVVVNLYPFERTVADPDCDLATATENIDIGGPAMLRAAAKNHAAVAAVVDSGDYAPLLEELERRGRRLGEATRRRLAAKAFEHTARYDRAIAGYFDAVVAGEGNGAFPETWSRSWRLLREMRYGENPHQRAAFYADAQRGEASISSAELLQGKPLSYNNVADADAALECVRGFEPPACVIVKHANPCGVAVGEGSLSAYERAFSTDPSAAFGGIIAFNRPLDSDTAKAILERQFVEVIVAPAVEPDALPVMAAKPEVRLLACGELASTREPAFDSRAVNGGLLVQERDLGEIGESELQVMTKRTPTEAERTDLLFAWKVVKHVRSNAIVYCRDGMTIGIGAGQMSRVYSARIAAIKAADEGLRSRGHGARLRRLLPLSGQRRHRRLPRRYRHRSARRLEARPRGHRRRRRARLGDGVHGDAAFPALSGHCRAHSPQMCATRSIFARRCARPGSGSLMGVSMTRWSTPSATWRACAASSTS